MSSQPRFTLTDMIAVVLVVLAAGLAVTWLGSTKRKLDGHGPYCLTNINCLVKSSAVYCEMNRGFLMPYTHNLVLGTSLTEAAPSAEHTAVCFAPSPPDPSGLLSDCRGFGLVYAAQILRPEELFYCPNQEHPRYRWDTYPRPWGSAVPRGWSYIYAGYMYNPWVKKVGPKSQQFVYEDGLVYEKHPGNRFLICDILLSWEGSSHPEKRNTFRWNMAFPDGHVESFKSTGVSALLTNSRRTDWASWENWGAVPREGWEAPPSTIRYHIVKEMERGLGSRPFRGKQLRAGRDTN